VAISINWESSPRIVTVLAPAFSITIQDLVDQIRDIEDEIAELEYAHLLDASGKDTLSTGIVSGITAKLLNGKLAFEARPGPGFVQCTVSGGNVVAVDGAGNPMMAIETTAYTQVVVLNQVGGVIATASGDVDAISAGVWDRLDSLILTPASIGLRVKTLLDAAISSRAAAGGAMTLTPTERVILALAIWHLEDEVEIGTDPIKALRRIAAISAGKVSGGPAHPDFKGIGVDTVRVHMDADADGNRTAVLFDP
jgi:hypothetical protein